MKLLYSAILLLSAVLVISSYFTVWIKVNQSTPYQDMEAVPRILKTPRFGNDMRLLGLPLWTVISCSLAGTLMQLFRLFNANPFHRAVDIAFIMLPFLLAVLAFVLTWDLNNGLRQGPVFFAIGTTLQILSYVALIYIRKIENSHEAMELEKEVVME